MAVPLEFANVLLHKALIDAIDKALLERVAAASPPNWAEDSHLVRVGFMSTSEAYALIDSFLPHDPTSRFSAVVGLGLDPPPGWISTGEVEHRPSAWLTGTAPGPLAQPAGGASLHQLPGQISWGRLELMLGHHGISWEVRDSATRLLRRGDAICDLTLLEMSDGASAVAIHQPTGRRAQCSVDRTLLSDILMVIRTDLRATALWPPKEG